MYRVVEFANGWTGKVISTQWVFSAWSFFSFLFPNLIVIVVYADVFDGTMIVLAMYTLNLFHPGIYLRGEDYPSQTSSEGVVMEERLKPTYDEGKAV
jgi:hypothetical protein